MKQKNKTILKDISWLILFIILIVIPGIMTLIHPILISNYYSNPIWLLLYLALPAELYGFFLYSVVIIELIFK